MQAPGLPLTAGGATPALYHSHEVPSQLPHRIPAPKLHSTGTGTEVQAPLRRCSPVELSSPAPRTPGQGCSPAQPGLRRGHSSICRALPPAQLPPAPAGRRARDPPADTSHRAALPDTGLSMHSHTLKVLEENEAPLQKHHFRKQITTSIQFQRVTKSLKTKCVPDTGLSKIPAEAPAFGGF